jgi:NAD(P)H-dependent FMN reductase
MLTLCGSLQVRSANRAALEVARECARAADASIDEFDRLAEIPAFDPDHGDEPGPVVADWRRRVASADVLLVAAPEYAGALAGAAKNALDWLVGSGELYRKPVAVLSAGTTGGVHARQMVAQTLTWQGAYVVAEAGIAAPRTKSDEHGRLTDAPTLAAIAAVTSELLAAPTMGADELVRRATAVVGSLGVDVGHVAPAF